MNHPGYAIVDNSRIQKAKKIIACLEYIMGERFKDKKVLEIGGGSCLISYEISKLENEVICTDLKDETFQETIDKCNIQNHVNFLIADGRKLPFKHSSFDIVIANQVLEHVPKMDHQKLIDESYRVLKTGGLFYVATPNKLWPIEPHTKLPFLSYLPPGLANKYIKLTKGVDKYDVYLLTYNQLKDLTLTKFKTLINLTPIIIKNPETFYIKSEIPNLLKSLLEIVPLNILWLLNLSYPSWILVG